MIFKIELDASKDKSSIESMMHILFLFLSFSELSLPYLPCADLSVAGLQIIFNGAFIFPSAQTLSCHVRTPPYVHCTFQCLPKFLRPYWGLLHHKTFALMRKCLLVNVHQGHTLGPIRQGHTLGPTPMAMN